MEARDAQFVRDREENVAAAAREAAARPTAELNPAPEPVNAEQEGETVSFDPCMMWGHYPVKQVVVQSIDFPALVLTGWRMVCPAHWSLSGMLHAGGWEAPTPSSMAAQRRVDWCLCFLIFFQWILVGGLPLTQSRHLWAEPGAFISVCAVLAFGLVAIPVVDEVAQLPSCMAGLAWFWWFGLLVWKGARAGWRLVWRLTAPGR
jgi:hypothetical protein